MQSQGNIRVVEMLRYLYQHTDENHPATVTDITAYLKERGIQAVRQTVYADLNALITAGFDIVIVKSTQNQYFIGSRLFEYPELKMLEDAVENASKESNCEAEMQALQSKITALTTNLDQMYMDRLNGLLSEEDFQRIYQKVKMDRTVLEDRLKSLQEQAKQPVNTEEKAKALVKQFLDSALTSRELLVSLIERVELTEEKEIIIKFRFHELEAIS